jgi:hypothetical protein
MTTHITVLLVTLRSFSWNNDPVNHNVPPRWTTTPDTHTTTVGFRTFTRFRRPR